MGGAVPARGVRAVANVRRGAIRTLGFGIEKSGGGVASAAPRGRVSGRERVVNVFSFGNYPLG